jgi:hypothetical protein
MAAMVEPKQEANSDRGVDDMRCPTDLCIVYQRKIPGIDCQHLNRLAEERNLRCIQKTCNNVKAFVNVRGFLWNAATVHSYDLNIGILALSSAVNLLPTTPSI